MAASDPGPVSSPLPVCPHIDALLLRPPPPTKTVYREECTQCFDDQDGPDGVDVCMICFNGGCSNPQVSHAKNHAVRNGHWLALNIRRRSKIPRERAAEEPPLKKLAIKEEREEEQYTFLTRLKCYAPSCNGSFVAVPETASSKVDAVASGVLSAMSSAQRSEVKAWEEEIELCPHAATLVQNGAPTELAEFSHCSDCDFKQNLWLCLSCGNLGCGRQQFGGMGGNGHGLAHYEHTGHPVNVKMGTITPEGAADIYCYACNDARLDPYLVTHLLHFGIKIASQAKTEKTMTELQIEQNLRFEFAMTGADGRELEPVAGPGLTGLRNLGNSCYMASVLQMLFSLQPLRDRFSSPFASHPSECDQVDPAACFECQMEKIAHGLLSGRYAVPSKTEPPTAEGRVFQDGVRPTMFKSLVGKGHPEFSTMRQQDADEYLRHLFKLMHQSSRSQGSLGDPILPFMFKLEQRLQCTSCEGVRYQYEDQSVLSVPVPAIKLSPGPGQDDDQYVPVQLTACLDMFTAPQTVDYTCPKCQTKGVALTTSKFATFPRYLVLQVRRFELVNWVPKKLEIPVMIAGELCLDAYVGTGQSPAEVSLPEEEHTQTPGVAIDPQALANLESMGFPTLRAQKGLLATGDADVEQAMMWILEHADDPDIDLPVDSTGQSRELATPEQVQALSDMGFTPAQAQRALLQTDGNVERAVEWLFSHPEGDGTGAEESSSGAIGIPGPLRGAAFERPSLPARYLLKAFISHKGPSVHSGHYVCHVRYPSTGWVLYNDEKVVKAGYGAQNAEALAPQAYLLLLERLESGS